MLREVTKSHEALGEARNECILSHEVPSEAFGE